MEIPKKPKRKFVPENLNIDAWKNLKRLGLDEHLSAQRSNGLKAMVEKISSLN